MWYYVSLSDYLAHVDLANGVDGYAIIGECHMDYHDVSVHGFECHNEVVRLAVLDTGYIEVGGIQPTNIDVLSSYFIYFMVG